MSSPPPTNARCRTLIDTGLADAPEPFATNTLVVALPAGNPAGITSLRRPRRRDHSVLCAPEVPCGAASQTLLDAAGVSVTAAASLEQNVSAVLQKIVAGEADAGLVYATDVVGEDVESFAPEGSDEVVNRYPIVALDGATDAGRAFTEFVRVRSAAGSSPTTASAHRDRGSARTAEYDEDEHDADATGRHGRSAPVPPGRARRARCPPAPRCRWSPFSRARPGRPSGPTSPPRWHWTPSASHSPPGSPRPRCASCSASPLALLIARSGPRTSALLRALVAVPLVLPPMVGGVALLFLLGRSSPLGGLIAAWFGTGIRSRRRPWCSRRRSWRCRSWCSPSRGRSAARGAIRAHRCHTRGPRRARCCGGSRCPSPRPASWSG